MKNSADFVDFAVGLRRFPALPVKFEFQRDIRVCKPVSIKHGLRTTDCRLGIKYGLVIKRGLENTDWV